MNDKEINMKDPKSKLNILKKWDRIFDKLIAYVERLSKNDKDFKSLRQSVLCMDAFERSNLIGEIISSVIKKTGAFSDKMRWAVKNKERK